MRLAAASTMWLAATGIRFLPAADCADLPIVIQHLADAKVLYPANSEGVIPPSAREEEETLGWGTDVKHEIDYYEPEAHELRMKRPFLEVCGSTRTPMEHSRQPPPVITKVRSCRFRSDLVGPETSGGRRR